MRRASALLVLAFALLGTAVLGGCSNLAGKAGSGLPPMKVGVLQDNTTVSLAQGQELVVSLPANPSTGFIWEIEALPAYVATEGAPAYASGVKETTPALVGVSGEMTFTFRATRATSGTLELAYHRPWEQKPATRTYRLTLNAK